MGDHVISFSDTESAITQLLESLKYNVKDNKVQSQALHALSNICSENEQAQNYLNNCGGLWFILDLAKSSESSAVRKIAFYCIAGCVEKNVAVQSQFTKAKIFKCILYVGSDPNSDPVVKYSVVYLLLVLVSNNSSGQTLAMKSGCIQMLMQFFRSSSIDCQQVEQQNQRSLWECVVSALSCCVNNPVNGNNQLLCGSLLPYSCSLLNSYENDTYLCHILYFISVTVSGNEHNQNRTAACGGLGQLLSLLGNLASDVKTTSLRSIISVIDTLDNCILDNAQCVQKAINLGIVPNLLNVLSLSGWNSKQYVHILLLFAHSLENNVDGQQQFRTLDGHARLTQLFYTIDYDDTELYKSLLFVTQILSNFSTNCGEEVIGRLKGKQLPLSNPNEGSPGHTDELQNDDKLNGAKYQSCQMVDYITEMCVPDSLGDVQYENKPSDLHSSINVSSGTQAKYTDFCKHRKIVANSSTQTEGPMLAEPEMCAEKHQSNSSLLPLGRGANSRRGRCSTQTNDGQHIILVHNVSNIRRSNKSFTTNGMKFSSASSYFRKQTWKFYKENQTTCHGFHCHLYKCLGCSVSAGHKLNSRTLFRTFESGLSAERCHCHISPSENR